MASRFKYSLIFVVPLALFFVGCDSTKNDQLTSLYAQDSGALEGLGEVLTLQKLPNSIILKEYAQWIAANRPEFSGIANALVSESSADGQLFSSLKNRLEKAKNTEAFSSWQLQYQELQALSVALNPAEFNRALMDPINVLADLSQGKLPRISSGASLGEPDAHTDTGDASKPAVAKDLVGNANYGSWAQDASGNTFWEWYGKYALFSQAMNGARFLFQDWAGGRGSNYYRDRGRDIFTSPDARQRQEQVIDQKRQQSHQSGQPFRSPFKSEYSKKTSSSYDQSSNQAASGNKPFASEYSKEKKQPLVQRKNQSYSSSRYSGRSRFRGSFSSRRR